MYLIYESWSSVDLEKFIETNKDNKEFSGLVKKAKEELEYRKLSTCPTNN